MHGRTYFRLESVAENSGPEVTREVLVNADIVVHEHHRPLVPTTVARLLTREPHEFRLRCRSTIGPRIRKYPFAIRARPFESRRPPLRRANCDTCFVENRILGTSVACITASGRPTLVQAGVLGLLLAVPPGRDGDRGRPPARAGVDERRVVPDHHLPACTGNAARHRREWPRQTTATRERFPSTQREAVSLRCGSVGLHARQDVAREPTQSHLPPGSR